MKSIATIGLYAAVGVVLFNAGKAFGYAEGAMDVLVENDINSFTKECKNGYSVTISKRKKKGE